MTWPWLRATLVTLLFAGSLGVFAQSSALVAGQATFRVSVPADTSLGEPLVLEATLTNTGSDSIDVDFGWNSTTQFQLQHTRPDGSVEELRPGLPIPRGTSVLLFFGNVSLTPNQANSVYLVLDEWLTFRQKGRHRLVVEFLGPVNTHGGSAVTVDRTTEFSINVGPRDPVRLRGRCEEWLKTIQEAHLAVEVIAAATALGHVVDPVAVPFLEAAAARASCGSCFLTLVKIETPDSIAALRRLADSPFKYVRDQARGALATFAKRLVPPRRER